MRITSKGQVTIPKTIREALGVGPGSEVGFENREGEVVLVNLDKDRDWLAQRPGETRGDHVVRVLQEFGMREDAAGRTVDLTTDEIMEMTRGPIDDVDPR
jgi:AbrB family looped-hinge helix DNA binding protein